jgi:hypothetical protein
MMFGWFKKKKQAAEPIVAPAEHFKARMPSGLVEAERMKARAEKRIPRLQHPVAKWEGPSQRRRESDQAAAVHRGRLESIREYKKQIEMCDEVIARYRKGA